MSEYTPSSRRNPCPMCDRTRDGDCRIADSGIVLCHTHLNGVAKGHEHPERPFIYCGQSDDAQGFGIWKPSELHDPSQKAERAPLQRLWTYQRWDGSDVPVQRKRTDTPGKPKWVGWESKFPADLRQSDIAPFQWHATDQQRADGELLFVVKGELKAEQMAAAGFACISILDPTERLITELRAISSQVVLAPDCDLADLEHWYRELSNQLPLARHCFPPLKGMDWRNPPADHGLGLEDWLQRSKPDEAAIIQSITTNPWKPVAEPSGAAQGDLNDIRDEFLRDAQSLKERLDRGLEQIDAIPDVATRSVALHTLQKSLELNDKKFEALVRALSEAKAPKSVESFDDLMSEDEEDLTALVEDLFPSGLILIAAEGFAGKSNTAYQIAEAVTNGSKFAGQFQCQQAPALIVQMDESKTDAKRKFKVLGLQPAKGALTIKWHFSPMMFPELRRWVTETGSKLVILDSLMTIAGGTISPKDAEFGLLIYRLNQLAAELGLTIICLHHVVKAGGKQRDEIVKDDIFGTAYVYNGSSEAWGLWQAREDGNPEPVFNLRCLKARSGLVDQGTTYQFDGNDEDKRLTYRGMANRTITLDQIKTARDRVIAFLKSGEGSAFDPKTVSDHLQLGNPDYARRLCRELYERPSVPVGRRLGNSGGGRPAYLYFWADDAPRVRNTCTDTAESPSHTDTLQHLKQSFSTERDPSEREEREGESGEFRYGFLLTRDDEELPF